MKRFSSVGIAALLVVAGLQVVPASAAEPVNEATWTASMSPVEVEDDLVINKLTIEPGTEVVVKGDYSITIAGKMTALGHEGNRIVIRGVRDSAGFWKGIRFADTQDGSTLKNVEISNADIGVKTNRQNWTVSESYFHDNEVSADVAGVPAGDTASGRFVENYVTSSTTGVKVSSGVNAFSSNTITGNAVGVDLATIRGSYSRNNIYGNSTFNATTCDFVGTERVNATDNWWGTTDESDIADSICDGSDTGKTTSPVINYSSFESAVIADAATEPTAEPAPEPPPESATEHARTVSLVLRRHLRARGVVAVTDGFAGCMPASVVIQRVRSGVWTTVKTAAVDAATGAFATRLRDRPGGYRASVAETATSTDVCTAAYSAVARHRHR